MRIGFIIPGIWGSFHHDLAKALAYQGNDVIVYTEDNRAPSGVTFTRIDEGNLRYWVIHCIRRNPWAWLPDRIFKYWLGRRFFTTLVAIWRFIRANRDRDMFIVENAWIGFFVAIISFSESFRWTVGIHDTDFLDAPIHFPGRPVSRWRTLAQNWVLSRADLVRANSHVTREALVAGGCAAEKIVTIPLHYMPDRMLPPLNIPLPDFRHECGRRIRKELGVPESAKLLVTMCRLTPVKHLELAIEALAAVRRADVWLVICGGDRKIPGVGSYADQLRILAAQREVATRVLLPGEIDTYRAKEFLAAADIHLAPSWIDTFNYGVIEAALVGTYSLTSKGVGAAPWVVAHDAARIIESDVATAWATAIEELLIRPPAPENMAACCAMLMKELSPASVARSVSEALVDCRP